MPSITLMMSVIFRDAAEMSCMVVTTCPALAARPPPAMPSQPAWRTLRAVSALFFTVLVICSMEAAVSSGCWPAFRALARVGIAHGDLAGARGNAVAAVPHIAHDAHQRGLRPCMARIISTTSPRPCTRWAGQVALANALRHCSPPPGERRMRCTTQCTTSSAPRHHAQPSPAACWTRSDEFSPRL